ncbi:ATP-dependent Clp protease ATP-binding subunit [Clostridium cochlearium]|uniref:ATP-dependent Clp protease ATP-binding subunit n=1 Tax=Clostridium cochlearium TaxID=1494 RepID=UPI00156F16C5|nr:ATP-dependent Clp protease ATP-binding subunit [Clostridium cochlearium]MBV1820375.1 ATP-dependent Clp protease ATP-binding subunit [Bacteroidales bacterium MSK.15.36]MCG4572834.1 ATP-dependent Clp protease ATP-binding subunit [Clostridium cochlearium]NSJ91943.1 ATP-dependent Clp protease ATP-binding subunit [Coprococcus sp. MSK.21.13]
MKLCSICNKNVATIFTTRFKDEKPQIVGICVECAKKMNVQPLNQIIEAAGVTPEDMETYAEQMNKLLENMDINELLSNDLFSNIINNMSEMNAFQMQQDFIDKNNKNHNDEKNNISQSKSNVKTRSKFMNKKKNLNKYAINLNDKAKNNKIDVVVGRDKELERIIQILNRRNKNNPILIGEPGVGKTAIAEGLAVKIIEKNVPIKLLNKEIYLLDLTSVVAGTQFRGQFEGRMKAIVDEVTESENVILVIDEVHNIIGAGEAQGGALNAANILKPALARGDIQVIGATTLEEYRKYIEKDSALERRFQPILVEEPSVDETIEILNRIKVYYEEYHNVKITKDVVEEAVKLSKRYITDRYLPDKAIDVIDEASSRANLRNKNLMELKIAKEELEKLQSKMLDAANNGDYEKAAQYKTEEYKLKDKVQQLEKKSKVELSIDDIAYVIEAWTKIPVQKVREKEVEKLLNLEQRLHKRVIGQDKAVRKLSRTIRRNRLGFKSKKRPASFIFVGPTGVGKTELVKALACELFGDEDALIRIDMSEYMEKHTASKLIGSPPGYIGYDEGGQLTEKIRRKPYSVVLLDEIEKAHPDIFNMLLQVLEDGRLTDNQGKTVFFDNSVIIMTSNLGTNFKESTIGFGNTNSIQIENSIKDALKETFKPEFINRIDEIVVFEKLNKEELYDIIDIMFNDVSEDLNEKNIKVHFTKEVKDFILRIGYSEKYGARELRRAIQRYIEDEISEEYFRGKVKEGTNIEVDVYEDKIYIKNI